MAESWEEEKKQWPKKATELLPKKKKNAVQNTFCLPVGRILLASHFDQWESTFPPFKCLSQCKIQTAERLYLHINRSSQRARLAFLTASPNGTILLLLLREGDSQHESGLDRRGRGRTSTPTHIRMHRHTYTFTQCYSYHCYNSRILENLSVACTCAHTLCLMEDISCCRQHACTVDILPLH